jgi:hypothetical protein
MAVNPAGRGFVERVAAASYILALAAYWVEFPGHVAAVWILGMIGTAFLTLVLFASDKFCLILRHKLTGRW